MKSNQKPMNFFNLTFRTTYFSKSRVVRKIYSSILYSVSILLFIFLILSLVMTFSFNINANYFIKSDDTKALADLYSNLDGTKGLENYQNWSKSNETLTNAGKYTNIVGGSLTFSEVLGISQIVTSTSTISFISIVLILFLISFRKQTIASYLSLTLSFAFLITLIVLFSILIQNAVENDNIKNIMTKGNELKASLSSENSATEFPSKLNEFSLFLQGLKK